MNSTSAPSVAHPRPPAPRFGAAWDDARAGTLKPVDRLIYRSNLLGADHRITNTGGGNTSSKTDETDPVTGRTVRVLWVKGSGGDLRTATRANFASLVMDQVLALREVYASHAAVGVKTPAEDRMVGMYPHCAFNLNPCAASIDTPLHAFVPFAHVDHTHPIPVIAIAASRHGERLTREVYGDEVAWLAWQRPGFDLGLKLGALCESRPNLKGAVLGQHGLICWADDDRACYELSRSLIERAAAFIESRSRGRAAFGGARFDAVDEPRRRTLLVEILPWLRGQLSGMARPFGTVEARPEVVEFTCGREAAALAALGTSCPDHFLRTKIRPLLVDWDPSAPAGDGGVESLRGALARGLAAYREEYGAYYRAHAQADSPAMRDPNPSVVLIPGVGMIAWGKSKSESRVTAEFYAGAVEVMRGAGAIDEYVALPPREAFDIEYWSLEEAKLRRMPAEKELARRVVAVIGAGSGIGRCASRQLATLGAHVACADRTPDSAQTTARDIVAIQGAGIGVAGTGISSCGPAVGLGVDMTDRRSVRALYEDIVLAYGGLDALVITAGVYLAPDAKGANTDEEWAKSFEVNVRGVFVAADEAAQIWRRQALPASLVITTSVNGVVSKRGSLAYDTSKAAADHLVRELAIELAPLVRVNAVAPATVVDGSSMFPIDRVKASLAKYNLPFEPGEPEDALRGRLAQFYAQRSLLKLPITPDHNAEAVLFLVSERSARTTGQIINVDGGLHEAFLR